MNNKHAKDLSRKLTNEQIADMIEKAKVGIRDWTKASVANKGLSRGVHWNMFARRFDVKKKHSNIYKYRLIQEYGKFLPEEYQPQKKEKVIYQISHQDPIFD